MKRHLIPPSVFALVLSLTTTVLAQKPLTISHACNFDADATQGTVYTFDASKEATQIVDKIMKVNVLPQNFVLKSADCKNALATVEGKQRFILYNTTFLENFKKEAQTQWAVYSVLAHEIGHHLSNHDLGETDLAQRKVFELEADRFAGGVLFRLGASLEQAQAGINSFSLDGESTTHPAKKARLNALAVGWKQAEEAANTATGDNADINSDETKLYKKAVEIAKKDKQKAVELLDEAIAINPNYSEAFTRRADFKWAMEDKEGAKEDMAEAIRLNKNAYEAYAMQGNMLTFEEKFDEALANLNRAIRIKKDFADTYYYRAILYKIREQQDWEKDFLKDLDKEISLDSKFYQVYQERARYFYGIGQAEKAIADLDKAIETNPDLDAGIWGMRAAAKQYLGKYTEAIADLDALEQKQGSEFEKFFNRAECYHKLNQHEKALSDWNKVIQKFGTDAREALLARGTCLLILGKNLEAEADFKKAIDPKFAPYLDEQKIGCWLVEYGFKQQAIIWLDKALAQKPDLKVAQDCRKAALNQ